MREATIDNHL